MEMETYLDDNVIIPDWIKKMTREEKQAEIERLEMPWVVFEELNREKEAREEKARILAAKALKQGN